MVFMLDNPLFKTFLREKIDLRETLITNAKLIDPSENLNDIYDILIKNRKIEIISKNINKNNISNVIDAKGNTISPGFIDLHVHYREPGETYKENIRTGSIASAKGGFTTVLMMANTNPTMDNLDKLKHQKQIIETNSIIRTLQTASVTHERKGSDLVDIDTLSEFGVLAFSNDGDAIEKKSTLEKALVLTTKNNRPILEHCEDPRLIDQGTVNDGSTAIRLGLLSRSKQAEINILKRDISIAKKNNGWIYFQHITSKKSLDLIKEAKSSGLRINAEVTPNHLFMNENWIYGKKGQKVEFLDFDSYDTNTRVNPPLRDESDRIALIEAVNNGIIDIIATDHAPHSKGDKLNLFDSAPAGINSAETAVPILVTLSKNDKLNFNSIVEKMANNPGQIISHISGLKIGKIKEGYEADLTIIDTDAEQLIDEDFFVSKSTNSPIIGMVLKGKVLKTIYRGEVVYES